MAIYQGVRGKPTNIQLSKLKSVSKNKAGTMLTARKIT